MVIELFNLMKNLNKLLIVVLFGVNVDVDVDEVNNYKFLILDVFMYDVIVFLVMVKDLCDYGVMLYLRLR